MGVAPPCSRILSLTSPVFPIPPHLKSMEESKADKDVKGPNLFERAKDEVEAIFHKDKKKTHEKETHGMSDDIDEGTPIDKVKGPSVFERAKEEIEALVEAIHPKKEPDHEPQGKKKDEGGIWETLGTSGSSS